MDSIRQKLKTERHTETREWGWSPCKTKVTYTHPQVMLLGVMSTILLCTITVHHRSLCVCVLPDLTSTPGYTCDERKFIYEITRRIQKSSPGTAFIYSMERHTCAHGIMRDWCADPTLPSPPFESTAKNDHEEREFEFVWFQRSNRKQSKCWSIYYIRPRHPFVQSSLLTIESRVGSKRSILKNAFGAHINHEIISTSWLGTVEHFGCQDPSLVSRGFA